MRDLLKNIDPGYPYSPIADHDTWISVDPIVGCQLDCQYCYMQLAKWTAVRPQLALSVSEIVDKLLTHKYFTPHQTVLCFGNQTDPFLPDNAGHTVSFLKALDANRLRNCVAVVTKQLIPTDVLDKVCSLTYVRPIFCLSYSGLPERIEPGVRVEDTRRNFHNLWQRGLSIIHLWRPLVEVNGTWRALEAVLDHVVPYSSSSVYLGLQLNPRLIELYRRDPFLQVPSGLARQYGQYVPNGVEGRLRDIAERKYPDYPLYQHTSCAVSLCLSVPDYNATVYTDRICKASTCPAWKRTICENARAVPAPETIKSSLRRIGRDVDFRLTGDAVEILGRIDQEDYVFLLHQLNYPLVARDMEYSRLVRGSIFGASQGTL